MITSVGSGCDSCAFTSLRVMGKTSVSKTTLTRPKNVFSSFLSIRGFRKRDWGSWVVGGRWGAGLQGRMPGLGSRPLLSNAGCVILCSLQRGCYFSYCPRLLPSYKMIDNSFDKARIRSVKSKRCTFIAEAAGKHSCRRASERARVWHSE